MPVKSSIEATTGFPQELKLALGVTVNYTSLYFALISYGQLIK